MIRQLMGWFGMNWCEVCAKWYSRRRVNAHFLGRHRQIVTQRMAARLAAKREIRRNEHG